MTNETKNLVDDLRRLLPAKVLLGDLIGAEGVYAHSGPEVYEDPEPYVIEQAADLIESLSEALADIGRAYNKALESMNCVLREHRIDPRFIRGCKEKKVERTMYRYYCIARPPMLSGLPLGRELMEVERFDGRRYVPEIDRMAWGWVEYAEPLTPMEISEYELISAPREDEPDE